MKLGCLVLAGMLAFAPGVARAQSDPKTLFDHGALRKAAAACQQQLATNPGDASSAAILARILAEQGRYDEAMKLAEKAVAAAPKSAEAHYALAEVNGQRASNSGPLSALGAAKAFKREAQAALELDPNDVDALSSLAEFHQRAPGIVGGDKKKVNEYLDRMEKVSPVRGLLERAEIAEAQKDTASAERFLRKAVDADPNSATAKVALAVWLAPSPRKPHEAETLPPSAGGARPRRERGGGGHPPPHRR